MKSYIGVNNLSKEANKVYVGYNNKAIELPITSQPYRIMTAKFNLNDSNPATWGTYINNAKGMTVGSADWDEFFGHYPCILDNGTELGKLKTDDMTKYENGSSAPITTIGKDVMICFPRRGLKIWIDNGYLYVSMTDAPNDSNFDYYAHTYKGNTCDKFYLGKYKGYVSSNKLYSVSGKTPTVSTKIGTFRTYAEVRGAGYEQSAFFQATYRQAMYMLKYLCQNAQIAIGRGFVDGNSRIYGATGYTNKKGMDWGETTGKYPMTLFGLEDFYGNIYEFIDGIYSDSNRKIKVSDGSYNDTGSGYTDAGTSSFSSDIDGRMKSANGTSIAGFTISSNTYGTDSTYFCDNANIRSNRLGSLGGRWVGASAVGVFCLTIDRQPSDLPTNVGSRLMYMHVES